MFFVAIMVLMEIFAPKGLAVFIAIANIFIPDGVPFIDEVLQAIIAVKRLSSD